MLDTKVDKPWLFFGLGNVLFNEDPAFAHIYLLIYNILQKKDDSITFEKLLTERDELIKEGHILPLKTLISEKLNEEEDTALRQEFRGLLEENWLKYNPINLQTKSVIKSIESNYNLGIIANGPSFLRAILQDVGILNYFDVVLISEEVGVPKPNKGIFLQALEQAETINNKNGTPFSTQDCFMVGDSLEQDISPAKELGMTTIQLKWNLDIKYDKSPLVDDSTFLPYFKHLQEHSSRRRKPSTEKETPQYTVESLKSLKTLMLSDEIRKKTISK